MPDFRPSFSFITIRSRLLVRYLEHPVAEGDPDRVPVRRRDLGCRPVESPAIPRLYTDLGLAEHYLDVVR